MKIRIVNFSLTTYKVQYKTFFRWHDIKNVNYSQLVDKNRVWNYWSRYDLWLDTKIFETVQDAKEFVADIKSFDDIKKWHKGQRECQHAIIKHRKKMLAEAELKYTVNINISK